MFPGLPRSPLLSPFLRVSFGTPYKGSFAGRVTWYMHFNREDLAMVRSTLFYQFVARLIAASCVDNLLQS